METVNTQLEVSKAIEPKSLQVSELLREWLQLKSPHVNWSILTEWKQLIKIDLFAI